MGWTSVVFGNESGLFGRPVSMASFLLNVLWLGTDIWGFKLVNVLLHLCNGVLVFALFNGFLRCNGAKREPLVRTSWLPWLGASIWLLHPLLVSTVLYVVQRMAMLSAMFMLVAMLAYQHGRIALNRGQHRQAWLLLLLAVPMAMFLATLSKENGVLVPALCGVIELSLFQPRIGSRRPWQSTAFLVASLVLPALLAVVLTVGHADAIVGEYANRTFTLGQRLLTQPRVLWSYIDSLILPYGPRLGLYHDDYSISHGLLDPPSTALALAAWMTVLASAVWLRRKVPGFLLGVGVFLVGQALESSVFPLLMYFEHRNYLPAVGAIWALISLIAYAAKSLEHRMHHSAYVFSGGGVALVLVLALATAARASVWQRQQTILAQGLQYHPQSTWLRMDLADQAMHQRPVQLDEARRNVDFLLNSTDASTRRLAAVSRLIIDCSAGVHPQPENIKGAFSGRPDPIQANLLVAFENLSEGVMKQPCPSLSASQLADMLAGMLDRSRLPAGNVGIWRLRLKAAKLYLASGRTDQSLRQAQLAYADGTADAPVPVFIALLLLQRGDSGGAAKMLDTAESHMALGDTAGHAIVARYRAQIQSAPSQAPQVQ